jgi:hypothetical protein
MRKAAIFLMTVLLVVPFLTTSGKAYTLSFEGKAAVAGYRGVENPSWNIIKNCNISLFFTRWVMFKSTLFCWFYLRNGELSICNQESNYNYTDGVRIKGFLIFPKGIWTLGDM